MPLNDGTPILLDAYCGVGGATRGYQLAGWYVIGVDNRPQPDYCGDHFIHGDAVETIRALVGDYDAAHASPPCLYHTRLNNTVNRDVVAGRHLDLIPETWEALENAGVPYVMENTPDAPLYPDLSLCGEMFGLRVIRHRIFETNHFEVPAIEHVPHRGKVKRYNHGKYHDGYYIGVHGTGSAKCDGTTQEWQDAMGIHWTDNRKSLAQAIPPAYTEYIGTHLLKHITQETS